MFINKTELTSEMWIDLLESRRLQITPFLKSFTLPEIGSFRSVRGDGEIQNLNTDKPKFSGDESLLKYGVNLFNKIQGIFDEQPLECVRVFDSDGVRLRTQINDKKTYTGIKHLWGITRSGEWVLVRINFVLVTLTNGSRLEQALSVDIRHSSPVEILKVLEIKPIKIWMHIGITVDEWVNRRFTQYSEIKRLKKDMEFDSKILFGII
ncbi:MAG TPA: hypothetical protein PJ997_00490 [Candidatus Paceibacterota bacterium]|nr:hypothetical protein [Candidatus Paceibacterota bacterium]HMP18808.1 hypothetical protein [Candidatus Paceibacterota bacterium]HMP85303.1 hypothetical protein [Candidatus Paceibacterota bacterium]